MYFSADLLRKLLMGIILGIARASETSKGLLAIFIIDACLFIVWRPYRDRMLNVVEIQAVLLRIVVLGAALLAVQETISTATAGFVMFVSNVLATALHLFYQFLLFFAFLPKIAAKVKGSLQVMGCLAKPKVQKGADTAKGTEGVARDDYLEGLQEANEHQIDIAAEDVEVSSPVPLSPMQQPPPSAHRTETDSGLSSGVQPFDVMSPSSETIARSITSMRRNFTTAAPLAATAALTPSPTHATPMAPAPAHPWGRGSPHVIAGPITTATNAGPRVIRGPTSSPSPMMPASPILLSAPGRKEYTLEPPQQLLQPFMPPTVATSHPQPQPQPAYQPFVSTNVQAPLSSSTFPVASPSPFGQATALSTQQLQTPQLHGLRFNA